MNSNHSNFNLPDWIKNLGGGVAGSSVGIGFESLGFLVGVPLAGTGFWTYAAACKGDKGCTARVQNWWNKNKPQKDKISDSQLQTGGLNGSGLAQGSGLDNATTTKKDFNYKPLLYVGGGLAVATLVGYFIYKATK